ncbi:MAG TPA: DUF1027 domain-containing protein [Bacilli bacterium]|nr:DUF1027 domain-containing protein [Bacilli bacterium]HPZ23504.1 DUF1027 domain-containing protein [Bacilli bacterium]HQC83933.1 DUF1027 domain-containing protein [Bacilli bacterium]
MELKIEDKTYEVIKNYKDGYDEETVKGLITDYFYDYDYIFGDWAYGKLRLKGFYKENNQEAKRINNIKYLDDYIKLNCAYDCKYFLLEKKG